MDRVMEPDPLEPTLVFRTLLTRFFEKDIVPFAMLGIIRRPISRETHFVANHNPPQCLFGLLKPLFGG